MWMLGACSRPKDNTQSSVQIFQMCHGMVTGLFLIIQAWDMILLCLEGKYVSYECTFHSLLNLTCSICTSAYCSHGVSMGPWVTLSRVLDLNNYTLKNNPVIILLIFIIQEYDKVKLHSVYLVKWILQPKCSYNIHRNPHHFTLFLLRSILYGYSTVYSMNDEYPCMTTNMNTGSHLQ